MRHYENQVAALIQTFPTTGSWARDKGVKQIVSLNYVDGQDWPDTIHACHAGLRVTLSGSTWRQRRTEVSTTVSGRDRTGPARRRRGASVLRRAAVVGRWDLQKRHADRAEGDRWLRRPWRRSRLSRCPAGQSTGWSEATRRSPPSRRKGAWKERNGGTPVRRNGGYQARVKICRSDAGCFVWSARKSVLEISHAVSHDGTPRARCDVIMVSMILTIMTSHYSLSIQ